MPVGEKTGQLYTGWHLVASPRTTACEKHRRSPDGRQVDHCTVNWLDHAMQTGFNCSVSTGQWQRGLGLFNVKRSIVNVRPTCVQ